MKVILFIIMMSSQIALSYPENVRHGYTNCTSCHVSPTGGGALNSYGRSFSAEMMSTWAKEKEENYFFSPPPSQIFYGGNVRYVNLNINSPDFSYSRRFLMQADLELALEPIPGLIFAGTYGVYNVDPKYHVKPEYEQRRNYVLINISDNLSFRAGRFFPAYGLHFADHTLSVRRALGFDQGRETYNVEGVIKNKYYELFVTGVLGERGSLNADSAKGYRWQGDSVEHGLAARAAINYDTYQVGVSALRMIGVNQVRSSYGIYSLLGFSEYLYALAELDKLFSSESPKLVWMAAIGLAPMKGVHLTFASEGSQDEYHSWRWGLRLLPRPHWETTYEYVRKNSIQGKFDELIFVVHHYL